MMADGQPQPDPSVSPAQARAKLGVSRFIFDERIRPQLTEYKFGPRTVRFDRLELEAMLANPAEMWKTKKTVHDALEHTWNLKWKNAKGATKKGYIKAVVDKELGTERVAGVDYERLTRWIMDMRDRDLAVDTIRSRVSCLMYALKEAAKIGWIKGVPDKPELESGGKRTRFLADDPNEEQLLLAACEQAHGPPISDVMRHGIVFLVDVGPRLSELVKLRSDDITPPAGHKPAYAHFEDRKAHDSIRVPLTAAAHESIVWLLGNRYWMKRIRGADTSKTRCESAVSWFSHRFIEVRDKAGLPDVNVHTLRHTFASRLVQAGVSLYKVQKLLGHASITTTERYAHLIPDTLSDALRSLETRRLPNKVRSIDGKNGNR